MVYPAIPVVLAMVTQARLVAAVMEAEVAGMAVAAEAINDTDRGDPNKSVLCLCHSPFLDSF